MTVAAVMLLAIPAGVQAATYTNTASHYHFTEPGAGWNQTTAQSGDVQYNGPVTGLTTANIIASSSTCSTAQNTGAWLLEQAQGSHNAIKALFNGTTEVTPRTFTTTGGRLAAEYSISYTFFLTQQVHQVIFASDGWDLVYVLTFTDNKTAFSNHSADFGDVFNSFAVDNEPASPTTPGGGRYGGMFSGTNLYIIIGLVAAVVAVAAVMMMRKGKGKQPATQQPAPGTAAAPPVAPRK